MSTSDFESITTVARLSDFQFRSNSMLISLTSSKCEVLGGNVAASGYRRSMFRMGWCSAYDGLDDCIRRTPQSSSIHRQRG